MALPHRPVTGNNARMDGMRVGRRTVLRAAAGAGLLAATGLTGCARTGPDPVLAIGSGTKPGVYIRMAEVLAGAWDEKLDLSVRPTVLSTAGSVANMALLRSGGAQVAISQVDSATDYLQSLAPDDPASPRALARLYDDVTHVVVAEEAPYRRLADLRGARVSIGPNGSGYATIARRLFDAAGIGTAGLGEVIELGLDEAPWALAAGELDAFFWSGGVPTDGIVELAERRPIRLIDLGDVLSRVRANSDVYTISTVPAATYRLPAPVSTLSVRNVLVATAAMSDDVAQALVRTVFSEQGRLAQANPAAVTIDSRSAIGTQPIPLHPGAQEFYRAAKDYSG